MLYGVLQILHSVIQRNNISQLEECGLHNHIDAAAQADLLRNLHGVDNIEFNIVLGNVAFQLAGKLLVQLVRSPGAVEQEGAALFQAGGNVIAVNIGLIMHGYKIGSVDKIRSHNRRMTETQMGNGYAAGLFTIVGEIALSVHIRIVADDFNSALISADSTVAAQAPELAGFSAGSGYVHALDSGQGGMGQIVGNGNSEIVFRLGSSQIIKYGHDIAGQQILGA